MIIANATLENRRVELDGLHLNGKLYRQELSSQLDHPSVCYRSEEDRQSVSSDKSRLATRGSEPDTGGTQGGGLVREEDQAVHAAGGESEDNKQQLTYPARYQHAVTSAGTLPSQSNNMLASSMNMPSPHGTPTKFTIQEPLPSGQFTISPQHPQVIVRSVQASQPAPPGSPLLKQVECREQLNFDYLDQAQQYVESPDSVLHPMLRHGMGMMNVNMTMDMNTSRQIPLAGSPYMEGQGQNMISKATTPAGAPAALMPPSFNTQSDHPAHSSGLYQPPYSGLLPPAQAGGLLPSIATRPGLSYGQSVASGSSSFSDALIYGKMLASRHQHQQQQGATEQPGGSLSNVMLSGVLGSNQALSYDAFQQLCSTNLALQMQKDGGQAKATGVHPAYLPNAAWTAPALAMPQNRKQPTKKKAKKPKNKTPASEKKRTSKFRGVSKHRLTKRWEASCWVHKRQLYLGGFDSEEKAARAYDVAALVCKGLDAQINFELKDYMQHIQTLRHCTQEELVAHIRRQSSAFSRGKSKYRGVSGQDKRWEARIGQYSGRKNVSFGVYDTEEEAARQYDRALITQRGRSAKTNFNIFLYQTEIMEYEKYIDGLEPEKRQEARKTITLPLNLEVESGSSKEKRECANSKKVGGSAALIYAEEVKKALKF